MPSWSNSDMFETPPYFINNIRKIKWLSHTWITYTQTDQPQNTTQTAMPLFELCRTIRLSISKFICFINKTLLENVIQGYHKDKMVPVEWFQYWPLKFLIVLKECMMNINMYLQCTPFLVTAMAKQEMGQVTKVCFPVTWFSFQLMATQIRRQSHFHDLTRLEFVRVERQCLPTLHSQHYGCCWTWRGKETGNPQL